MEEVPFFTIVQSVRQDLIHGLKVAGLIFKEARDRATHVTDPVALIEGKFLS